MRVAIYVRVSTQEQAKEGYSISEQLERLQKYCDAMTWVIHKKYIDPGYSGANTERPALQELIKDVKAGLIDKVVVYKLDRLSRSQLDTLYLIEKVFLLNNTDFVSMNENFDTSTPFGRAMIGILAVFAQLEREQIKERMAMGREARIKNGKWKGSRPPVGYDYNSNTGGLIVNEYEKIQILEAVDLFLKGTPLKTIENIFRDKGYRHKYGEWNTKILKRILGSKLYIGQLIYHGEWYDGLHEGIIPLDVHEKLQELLKIRRENYERLGIKHERVKTYLGGMLRCKQCGAKYGKQNGNIKKDGSRNIYYTCYSRSKKMTKMIKNPNCKNKNWKIEVLEGVIFDEIKKLSMDHNYIRELKEYNINTNDESNKINIINTEIEKIDNQISRFMDLYSLGNFTIEQVSSKINSLTEQKKSLENELSNFQIDSEELTFEETISLVDSFEDIIERGNFDEIRLLLTSLISYIELDNEDIYIHWKFI